MNWQHFRTILWLRWRLRVNQFKRAGALNAVLLAIFAVGAVILAVNLFIGLFFVGVFAFRETPAKYLLYVWDGLVCFFLVTWATGLLMELQRSESLSLEKFLHLPVSPTGAFLINYVSSLASFSLLLFAPAATGLALGLTFSRGPAMLLVLPLLASFVLMVTALTYQFQGWLASLMVNKRRRRTIVVLVTASFVLLAQTPNLINFLRPWHSSFPGELSSLQTEEQAERQKALSEKMTPTERQERDKVIRNKYEEARNSLKALKHESDEQQLQHWEQVGWLANACLPPGWLPLGAMAAAEGDVLPPLLGMLGLASLGAASLWRSYRTTLRMYTGQFGSGKRRPAAAPPPVVASSSPAAEIRPGLLEKKLPWVSEPAAAIALAGFRSLLRAPEIKMLLLGPIFMAVIFGGMLFKIGTDVPEAVRPLLGFGAMMMILLTLIQLMGNQFGFDRAGFRLYVLSAAPRREVLLGKNLAIAPLALGMTAPLFCILQAICPLRLDLFLSLLPQWLSVFLLYCLLANFTSIFAPMGMAPGTLKPTNMKGTNFLIHLLFLPLFPCFLGPTLLPLGIQEALGQFGVHGVPICLLLMVAECVAVVYVYRLVLTWQGNLLQGREKKILEIVTPKAE